MPAPLSIPVGAGEGDDEGDNTESCAVATAKIMTTKNIGIFKETDSAIFGIWNTTQISTQINVSSDDVSAQVQMVSTYRAGVLIEVRVVGGKYPNNDLNWVVWSSQPERSIEMELYHIIIVAFNSFIYVEYGRLT
nr:hypothetical protein Itr_chr04CG10710 [Ipomoea trifida]